MFQFKNKKINIFGKNDEEEDDDELFSGASSSDKLASIFDDDSPRKHPQDLKYVPPKQPLKDTLINRPVVTQDKPSSSDSTSEVLYATDGKLFKYKNSEVSNIGPVMCCIIHTKGKSGFTLLIYKVKTNIISKSEITASFQLLIQKANYVTFTDDNKGQWSLHVDGARFEELIIQVGICRAYSTFTSCSPPSVVIQLLSEGTGEDHLQSGDRTDITFCTWQVENWRKGTRGVMKNDNIRLGFDPQSSWHSGLHNTKLNERLLIFTQNNTGTFSITAYDVTIDSVHFQQDKEVPFPEIVTKYENHHSTKKASLISRMAKVGQPLLPATPKRLQHPPSIPTDSESDEERVHRRLHGNRAINNTASSTSSLEEINLANKEPLKHGNVSVDIKGHNQDFVPSLETFSRHSDLPLGQGTLIAYQPPSLLQQQQQQLQYLQQEFQMLKQEKEATKAQKSESMLSFLFTESRSQGTDIRVALSQLAQKVDLVYDKMNTAELSKNYIHSNTSELTFQTRSKPRELLAQITDLVEQVEISKTKLVEKEERIEELTKNYTLILQKNQILHEEKSDLINKRNFEISNQNKKIEELFSGREANIITQKDLDLSRQEIKKLKEELVSVKSDHTKNQTLIDDLKLKNYEQSTLFVTLKSENEKLKQNGEILEKNKENFEENLRKNEEIVKKVMEENENYKEKIRLMEINSSELQIELKKKLDIELQAKKELELELQLKRDSELELKKRLELELQSKKDLESDLRLRNESISQLREENTSIKEKKFNIETITTGTNIDPVKSSAGPTIEDLEAVGKDIMNSAYKKLKKVFGSSESYAKQIILENVVLAFRETIMDYVENKRKQSKCVDAVCGRDNESATNTTGSILPSTVLKASSSNSSVIQVQRDHSIVLDDVTNVPSVCVLSTTLPSNAEVEIIKVLCDSSLDAPHPDTLATSVSSNKSINIVPGSTILPSNSEVPVSESSQNNTTVSVSVPEVSDSETATSNTTVPISEPEPNDSPVPVSKPEPNDSPVPVSEPNNLFHAVQATKILSEPSDDSSKNITKNNLNFETETSNSNEDIENYVTSPGIPPDSLKEQLYSTSVVTHTDVLTTEEGDASEVSKVGTFSTENASLSTNTELFEDEEDKTWKTGPPPPPSPLFSNEDDDDDDWLS